MDFGSWSPLHTILVLFIVISFIGSVAVYFYRREKQILLKSLREKFEKDFLNAHDFYQTQCTNHISPEEYETEKINYVQSWAENRLKSKDPKPDCEQAAAIGAVEGDVQVIARAGSGKSATLVTRALFLQQHCRVEPDEMLLLAFNRKAAEEMQERLAQKLQGPIPHVMTFHALAYALVQPEKILFDEPEGEQSQSLALSQAVKTVIDQYLCDPNYHDKIRALMMAHFRDDWEHRLSEEEIWNRLKDRAIYRFTAVVRGFIQRCRKLSLTPEQLSERVNNHDYASEVEEHFLNLVQVFYASYLERLQATGEEDFDGIMQKAAKIVEAGSTEFRHRSGHGNLEQLRYVFIDEYQDFSELFHHLVQAIREQNPRARFFCVGDDWQAINGFAGSDLRFFQNFEQFFEDSCQLHVATNYRSAGAIVDVGNALMEGQGPPARAHHKEMPGKVVIADLSTFAPTPQERAENPRDNFTPAVLRLVNKAINDGEEVVLLCRMNGLPWDVNYKDQENRSSKRGLNRFLELLHSRLPEELAEKVTISTAHKYKGLQKDVVIVLDAVAKCYPLLHPDLIFTRVFGDSIERVIAEERRLFYVALTRAVKDLFILTDMPNCSPFLEDLERNIEISRLAWSDHSLLEGQDLPITIRVGNQEGNSGGGTYAIRDLLKDEGYRWDGELKIWYITRPAEGFSASEFANQTTWGDWVDGIEVGFYDYWDNKVALYHVDGGQWNRIPF